MTWKSHGDTCAMATISDESTILLCNILPTTCEWKATIIAELSPDWPMAHWVDIHVKVLGYLPDNRVCGIHESHRLENTTSDWNPIRLKSWDIAFDVRDKIAVWLEENA